jgi:predicted aminopeptidase
MFRKILGVLLVITVVVVFVYRDLLVYAIGQGYGQLKIVYEARPVESYLNDPAFPDSLKAKLRLIERARRFAIDSLGLHDTDNYKTLYDQQGKELMWVVTACEPFRLKEKVWEFPIVGAVPYKGFFNREKAVKEKEALERENYDVSVRNPGGWSTLGWFTDPILSNMLRRGDGDLASLIIHEMVHATLYVKDSSEFNENLASFIGDRGAELFLIRTMGDASRALSEFRGEDNDYRKVTAHMLRAAQQLDSLYNTFTELDSLSVKKARKQAFIQRIVNNLDTLTLSDGRPRSRRFAKRLPNNTYFMSFKTYEAKHDRMKEEWSARFHHDLRLLIRSYKDRYPFM